MGLSAALADHIQPEAEHVNLTNTEITNAPVKQKAVEWRKRRSGSVKAPLTPWALLRSQGWSVPEDLLTLVVKRILDARTRPNREGSATPAFCASIDDIWRNGLPVTVDFFDGTLLVEQWTIAVDWLETLRDGDIDDMDRLLMEVARHCAELPCDSAVLDYSVGASSGSGATFGPGPLREKRFGDVMTAMGRLVVTVTHAHAGEVLHKLVAVPGPQRRTIHVRTDAHTSSVAQHPGMPAAPIPTRFISPLAVPRVSSNPSTPTYPAPMGRPRVRLVGAYEENMLQGRLGSGKARAIPGFMARVSVACAARAPNPANVAFTAQFGADGAVDVMRAPYVGFIELASGATTGKGLYRVPTHGSLNVAISNPTGTLMKVFVVRYDLQDMPPNHKTFVRQSYQQAGAVKGAIHVAFASSSKGGVYVYGVIRAMFSYRVDEARVTVTTRLPEPKYSPYPASTRLTNVAMSRPPSQGLA